MEPSTKTPERDTKVTETRSATNTILWFFAPLALMLIHIFLRFSEFDLFPSFCRVDFLYFNPTFLEIARSTGVAIFWVLYVLTSIVAIVIFVLVSATILFRRHARGAAVALLLGTLIFVGLGIYIIWGAFQPTFGLAGTIRSTTLIRPETKTCGPVDLAEYKVCLEQNKEIFEQHERREKDRDLDGVPNEADNCPDTQNSGQADENKDGTGDACDQCTGARAYYRKHGL